MDRQQPHPPAEASLADILDLFEEHVYAGEVTPDGCYVDYRSGPTMERFIGGPVPPGIARGQLWESLIHADDIEGYHAFNRSLLASEDGEATYRLVGLDGATRILWDRARSTRRPDGSVLVQGIISDVTEREEADARAAEAADRFSSLLDVVGEHVYVTLGAPDGSMTELFQGPGAERLLGGAEPDAEMANWERAVHPDDRAAYATFNLALVAGDRSDLEYRLIGADGITRWVHDRAAPRRRRADGTVEISGIVSDVTDRWRMRAELAAAHAAVSRVVEAMDDHLYTLEVEAGGGHRTVYRGPHRERLIGGPLPGGDEDDRLWESLLHPDDRERWRAALARLSSGRPLEVEYRVAGLDGVQRIVLDQFRPRRGPDGTLFYDAIARDITERRRLEGELRRSMAEMQQAHTELDSAHRAAELQARTDELTGAFNRRHFAEIVGAALAEGGSGCGLLLLDADRFKQVNDVHGHVAGDAVLVELAQRLTSSLRAGECVARWGGEEFAVLLTGVASDHELRRRAEALRRAVGSTPMAAADATIGLTVSIGAARSVAGLGNLDSLIEAADRCLYAAKGQGRDRVCLVGELGTIEAEAREPEAVALARGLVFATGRRASFIEQHAEQVAALATAIAERLGLTAGMVLRCRLGGWLHDVGKVGIPHAILDKPGPLDAAEWAIMRTHPLHSEAIVHRIGALSEAAPAVRHHHERYDGGGYPDGLAGDAIPIEARVVAAADAYSAMTNDRVYATARSPRLAVDELRRSAGTHLDPAVVGALLATLPLDASSVPQIA